MRNMRAVLAALWLSSLCAWTPDKLTAELLAAAETGDIVKVENLIAAGAKVNAKGKDGMTPLLAAITKNHASTVKALIDKGARADAKDWSEPQN
jgi:ankyrin repeat protein